MKETVNKRLLQKEQTTNAILKASLTVFAELGYDSATISDISKIAKVTNGLVIQRFGSKEALYYRVLDDILVKNFPSFNGSNEITEGLLRVVEFIKTTGVRSVEELSLANVAFASLDSIPQSCADLIKRCFVGTKLNSIFEDEIEQGKLKNENSLSVFTRFFKSACDLTILFIKKEQPLPVDDVYIQLFRKLDALDQAKSGFNDETSIFENITENSLKLYNISTWYGEIDELSEPKLYFPKPVLRKAGLSGSESPDYVYKYFVDHVDIDDVSLVRDAIHRMYLGQYVEFECRWSAPSLKTIYYRCSGKRTKVENGVTRFEGILQNITSFKTLRNRTKTRNFFLNLIAQDYEYVSYVHLGSTPDDDFVEDYKSSEFLNKLTENWEHNNNFTDRFNILINKVLTSVDRERFSSRDNRQEILNSLKKNDRYKTSFKLRHFGVVYHYEVVFFPDRNDDKSISGLVCGIRLVNNSMANVRNSVEGEISTENESKLQVLADLMLNKHEATILANLKDHTFEICRASEIFARRNSFVPDFESFLQSYIKRDVYFEDCEKMIAATKVERIAEILSHTDAFAINYRDISRGEPNYFLMRFSRGENNLVAILITNINNEVKTASQDKDRLEDELRTKEKELRTKDSIIDNIDLSVLDLLEDIFIARKSSNYKVNYKVKYLTYILGSQIKEDYPEFGLTSEDISFISEASSLHDIGKIILPDSILYKKERLNKEETELVKQHTIKGEKLLQNLKGLYTANYYQTLSDVCLYHHERWNGDGYPNGLAGDDIPLAAQIVGLVDVFSALLSEKPYRKAYNSQAAIQMIEAGECGSFNPKLLRSFEHCLNRMVYCFENGSVSSETDSSNRISVDSYRNKEIINNQTLPVIAHISEQMPGGFFVYKNDSQGSLLFFNNIMVKYFNCIDRDDFIKYVNNSFKGIVHSDDYDKTINIINKQIEESSEDLDHTKYRIVCKNGEEKILDHYGHVTHSDAFGDVSYAFVQDITGEERTADVTHEATNKVEKPVPQNNLVSSRVKSLEGTRILLVDDNDLSRFMTRDTLEAEGAHVSDFSSGQAALDIIRKVKPFDIILVDLVMPEMNGVEVTRAIREWEEDKDIRVPIVAVTGEIDSDLARECLDEGANGCMSKPLVIPELARILILSMKEHSRKMESKLSSTIQKANTDVLTHVKNRTAYVEKLQQITQIIKNDPYYEFGIVGADINNLKVANDMFGHDIGDLYIKNCCKMLCDVFIHSPVYRTGGDEFSVILEGSDLIDYKQLMKALDRINRERSGIEEYERGRAHIAMGVAIYNPEVDVTVDDVIKRADEVMYKNKTYEKQRVAGSFKY